MMTQTQTTPAPEKNARHLPSESPYKGLMPFKPEDRDFFFGRERDTQIITANLTTSRLTVLYGPSGVGKSSVLQAGVLDGLRERARREIEDEETPSYIGVYFKEWRDAPEAALLAAVRAAIQLTFTDELAPATTLTETLRVWSKQTGAQILLILDQFEEYFLYHPNEDGAGTFASEFVDAVKQPDLRVNFMLSLREDALAQLDRFKGRVPNLFAGIVRINYLDARAARDAIEKPLAQYNKIFDTDVTGFQKPVTSPSVEIEPALVDAVLQQVRVGSVVVGEAGRGTIAGAPTSDAIELPYLQVVMTRLWDEERAQGSRVLRYDTLKDLGGAQDIVRAHLKRALSNLSPAQEALAAKIFDRLVTPSGSKIAQSPRDLASNAEVSEVEVNALLEQLSGGQYRIVRPVAASVEQGGAQRYEIFHDVLAGAILDWRAEYVKEQERRRTRRLRLVIAGVSALAFVAIFASCFAFQQQSIAVGKENERATAAANADQRALEANQAKEIAQAESIISQSKSLAAQSNLLRTSDIDASLLLGIEALKLNDSYEARNNLFTALETTPLITTLREKPSRVWSVSFSPDGKTLAFVSNDGTNLWDVHDPVQPNALGTLPTGLGGWTETVAFSPDGKTLASGTILWDVATQQQIGELRGHTESVTSVAFSPDGSTLASGDTRGSILLWDVKTQHQMGEFKGHTNYVRSVAFSPDGKMLASGGGNTWTNEIFLWDVATHQLVGKFKGQTGEVTSVRFGPDGKTLASGSCERSIVCKSGEILLWEVATQQRIGEFKGNTAAVNSVAFSPDGKTLASGSVYPENAILLWDVASQQRVGELKGHTDGVNSVAFSPDGTILVSGSADTTIRLWNVSEPAQLKALTKPLTGHTDWVESVAFSPDGKTLASGSCGKYENENCTAGELFLWDVTTQQRVGELNGHTDRVRSMAFSPNGKTLASGSCARDENSCKSGEILLWDVATQQRVGELKGHTDSVRSMAFSPDGKTLVSNGRDRTIVLWDLLRQQPVGELKDAGYDIAFSLDGTTLASTDCVKRGAHAICTESEIRMWDVRQIAYPKAFGSPFEGHKGDVNSIAFSPNGKVLASGSCANVDVNNYGTCVTGEIRLWDMSDAAQPKALGAPLAGHTDWVTSVVFSPDGKTLASGSGDKTIWLWDVNDVTQPRALGVPLMGHTDYVTSVMFSPDGKTLASGSHDKTIQLWKVGMDLNALSSRACAIVHRNMTRAEYGQYMNRDPAAYDTVYAKPENRTCRDLPVEPLPMPTPTPTP